MKKPRPRNMLPFLILLLVAISLGASGQVLLKAGLSQLAKDAPVSAILGSIFKNVFVFFGFACYGMSSLIYLVALKNLPLSYAYPMVALSYALVVALSWKVFGETVPPLRMGAVAVILAGVVMLALSYDINGEPPAPSGAPITGVETPRPDAGSG